MEILRAEKKTYYSFLSPFQRDKLFVNISHLRRCYLLSVIDKCVPYTHLPVNNH